MRANIGVAAGDDVSYADTVEWLNEYGDITKKYVIPDGYIYAHIEKYVETKHNANNENSILNIRPSTNAADGVNQIEQNGVLLSDKIPFSADWVASGETIRALSTVTISGIDKIVPTYMSSVIVYFYQTDGTYITAWRSSQINSLENPSNDSEIVMPISFYIRDSNASAIDSWANVGFVRILLGIKDGVNILKEDVDTLSINVPYYDFAGIVMGWYSTGQQYSNDKATQQNSADIAELNERTDVLETSIAELKATVESGNIVNVQTGQILYAVGDSITYGYGIGGNDYSWVKHVIDRNGYDSENSRNLGQSGLGFCTTSTSGNAIADVVGGTDFSRADIVTVALGINDWKNLNATLTDFWAGMEYCFNKIRTDNPYCKIFYILPFNARFIGTFDTFYCLGTAVDNNKERPYAYTLQTFINMIKDKFEEDTFKAFHVHIIDMVECPAINRYNVTTGFIDSIHPGVEAHAELGKEIARRIVLA